MAAPRASSFVALRNLTRHSASRIPRRSLHITGVNSAPSSLGPEQSVLYLGRSVGDLKSECRKRNLTGEGGKHELADRLSSHDMLQSRAFSIAMKKIDRRPLGASSLVETTPTRHFNTSRSLKAVGDSSTIDFAYLPRDFDATLDAIPSTIRVPILPDAYHINSSDARHLEPDAPVMKPEIYTVTHHTHEDAHAPSAMSEVVDNHAMEIDPFKLTESVGIAARRALGQGKKEAGAVKEVWDGFLEDLLGKKGGGPRLT